MTKPTPGDWDELITYAGHTQGCMVAAGHDECTCGYDDAEGKAQAAWGALKAENARLAAALRDMPTDNKTSVWHPIDSAPKMRKVIVHYLNELKRHRVVLACYYKANSLEMHDDYGWVQESSGDGYEFAPAGWYEEHDSDNPIMPLGGDPTHWMELPTPPLSAVPSDSPADVKTEAQSEVPK